MDVPICLPESIFVELEREPASFLLLDTEGIREVIELPMRDVMLRLMRLFEPPETDEDELAAPIELPMRDVRPEFILLPELRSCLRLAVGVLGAPLEFDTEGVLRKESPGLPVMELPIREVILRLMIELLRLSPEFADEGVREVRPEAIRLFVLVVGPLPKLDTEGAREVTDRLVMLGPMLRVEPGELGREEIDVLGLIILTELPRFIDVGRLGLLGGRIVRELMLLLGLRLITAEGLRPRLTLEGALTLGAGALALGAGRLAELLLPEFELFPSFFAAKTGS